MKRVFPLILALVLLLATAGCTGRTSPAETPETAEEPTRAPTVTSVPTARPAPTPSPMPVETAEPTSTPTPTPTPTPKPAYLNPFTGEALDEPLTLRPFTVMINNHVMALPQRGVGQADILYEVLTEGSITRFQGVFSDIQSAETIGPVRSIRPYFLDIALSYGAVIGHAGGSEEAYSRIWSERLNNIDGVRGVYDFNVFYRDSSRASRGIEHTLFTTGEDLYRCAEELEYPLTLAEDYDAGLRFVPDGTPADGESALRIRENFAYKSSDLTYDEDSGMYSMFQQGQDFIDANTGEKVLFRNVLTIFAQTWIQDDEGRRGMILTGSGDGYFACGGAYVPITWRRESSDDCFRYYLADGSELPLGVGTTYIGILPIYMGSVEFS